MVPTHNNNSTDTPLSIINL